MDSFKMVHKSFFLSLLATYLVSGFLWRYRSGQVGMLALLWFCNGTEFQATGQ